MSTAHFFSSRGRSAPAPQHQGKPPGCIAPDHVTCDACWEANPPVGAGIQRQTPPTPWTDFLTHACENITFPKLLLRAVKISEKHISL